MGELEAIEILKREGMTQKEAEEFIAGVKRGIRAMKEGARIPWSEVRDELTLDQVATTRVKVTITGESVVWAGKGGSRPAELIISDLTCWLEDEYGMKNVKVVVGEIEQDG